MRALTGSLGIIVGLSFAGDFAAAQQFSADLVTTNSGSRPPGATGKVYVSDGKVRIETQAFPGGFFLVDGNAKTAYFIRPAQRVFMEAKQSTSLTQIFVAVDENNPCTQWQTMAKIARAPGESREWRCDQLGPETIGGRSAIKYRVTSPQDRQNYGWIDPQLKFPMRVERDDGITINLENVRQAPQPASLFEIPNDYRKFDPARLIERIKQSDVWVDPPG